MPLARRTSKSECRPILIEASAMPLENLVPYFNPMDLPPKEGGRVHGHFNANKGK